MENLIYIGSVLVFLLIFCLYMQLRNYAVFYYRIKKICENLDKYDQLPNYDYMMIRFWVWPLSRFEKYNETNKNN